MCWGIRFGLSLQLRKDDFSDFYDFHLRHFLQNASGAEKDFHSYVSDIVSTRIAQLKLIEPFSKKALRAKAQIEDLKAFQRFLDSVDKWNSSQTLEAVIAENNKEIVWLKQQITELKDQLEVLRQY